jgi:UDP-glucose 4-epimerase
VPSLRDKRVLVTGGAGFVGSHIVDLLLRQGCGRVIALDNFSRGSRENLSAARAHAGFDLVEGDVRDRALIGELVPASDVVFHQAALRITQCAVEPREAFETMVAATFDLASLCATSGVEKVVFASSASVYGMAQSFPTAEVHHPYDDRTLYGVAKLFGEGAFRALGVPHVALRYFNVYGPRMDAHGRYTEVLVRWMERIESGLPPVIFGDGGDTMDFIDVRDVARANLLAAESELTSETFNIGSGVETSLSELAAALAAAMGRPSLAAEFAPARQVNAVARRLADPAKAERLLGFAPATPISHGLRDLVAWWRAQRQAAPAALAEAGH